MLMKRINEEIAINTNPFWTMEISRGKQDTVVGSMFESCCQVPGGWMNKKSWLRLIRNIPRRVRNGVTCRNLLELPYSWDEWWIHAIEHGWLESGNWNE